MQRENEEQAGVAASAGRLESGRRSFVIYLAIYSVLCIALGVAGWALRDGATLAPPEEGDRASLPAEPGSSSGGRLRTLDPGAEPR